MLDEVHFLRLEALARAAQEGPWDRFVAFQSASPPASVAASDDNKNARARDIATS